MSESPYIYIGRMLFEARTLLVEIAALSATAHQVGSDDVYDEWEDKVAEFKKALENSIHEIDYV